MITERKNTQDIQGHWNKEKEPQASKIIGGGGRVDQ